MPTTARANTIVDEQILDVTADDMPSKDSEFDSNIRIGVERLLKDGNFVDSIVNLGKEKDQRVSYFCMDLYICRFVK